MKKPTAEFPFRFAIEVRSVTDHDANRFSSGFSQAGMTVHYAEEVLEKRSVSFSNLPQHLRALADHYEQIQDLYDDDAVVIVGRRRGSPEDALRRRAEATLLFERRREMVPPPLTESEKKRLKARSRRR